MNIITNIQFILICVFISLLSFIGSSLFHTSNTQYLRPQILPLNTQTMVVTNDPLPIIMVTMYGCSPVVNDNIKLLRSIGYVDIRLYSLERCGRESTDIPFKATIPSRVISRLLSYSKFKNSMSFEISSILRYWVALQGMESFHVNKVIILDEDTHITRLFTPADFPLNHIYAFNGLYNFSVWTLDLLRLFIGELEKQIEKMDVSGCDLSDDMKLMKTILGQWCDSNEILPYTDIINVFNELSCTGKLGAQNLLGFPDSIIKSTQGVSVNNSEYCMLHASGPMKLKLFDRLRKIY